MVGNVLLMTAVVLQIIKRSSSLLGRAAPEAAHRDGEHGDQQHDDDAGVKRRNGRSV